MTVLPAFDPDPLKVFERWYQEAAEAEELMPDALTLATATREGKPSARSVLFKGFDRGGLLIFTNYESRKSQELLENPRAALVFYWPKLHRQVRVEGRVEKASREVSENYFRTRPRNSQISAWVSPQSEGIPDREFLESKWLELQRKYEGEDVPCPPFWGGFRVLPESFEFWVHREDRLHDRIFYRREGGRWEVCRLAP